MYIALNYIGNRYTPGEVIGDDLPEETLKWMQAKGAVKLVPDADEPKAQTEAPEAPAELPEPPAEAAEEAEADDEDVDVEPPEIDATEALVTAPTKKSGRGGKAK